MAETTTTAAWDAWPRRVYRAGYADAGIVHAARPDGLTRCGRRLGSMADHRLGGLAPVRCAGCLALLRGQRRV